MKKFVSVVIVALAALVSTLGLTQSAQAYPDVLVNMTTNRQVVYGGQPFTAFATSSVSCAWNLTWNGVTHSGTGTTFSPVFATSTVTAVTKIPLTGTCTYAAPTARSGARTAASTVSQNRTVMITLLPQVTAVSPPTAGSDLPNTGGPNLLFLLGGLGLLLTGATAVTVARRRAEESDPSGLVA